ncbi:hypothetical protein ACHAWF_000568 [Thalassiosira exigua]
MKMGAPAVCAGLLHDTVKDTDLTFGQVEALIGKEDDADEQSENLRQMLVAMTDNYWIIVVKLADRLPNMMMLEHMKLEKQRKISRETLDIFAPLAHRMGLWPFKSELEDMEVAL